MTALAPATADAALIAAYDRYVTGSGFQIGLVNAATGAAIALPAGVNTPDDELHPTLSPDGRYLVFMRTKLLPEAQRRHRPAGGAHPVHRRPPDGHGARA